MMLQVQYQQWSIHQLKSSIQVAIYAIVVVF